MDWDLAGGTNRDNNQEFEGAITHSEGCLPLMAHCDTNIVVASMKVKLCIDLCTAQLVEIGEKWDWVLILLCDLVEVAEVDTESQGAILLRSKEDWCTAW